MLHTGSDDSPPRPLAQLINHFAILLRGFAPTGFGECLKPDVEDLQVLGELGIPLVQSGLYLGLLFLVGLDLPRLIQ